MLSHKKFIKLSMVTTSWSRISVSWIGRNMVLNLLFLYVSIQYPQVCIILMISLRYGFLQKPMLLSSLTSTSILLGTLLDGSINKTNISCVTSRFHTFTAHNTTIFLLKEMQITLIIIIIINLLLFFYTLLCCD